MMSGSIIALMVGLFLGTFMGMVLLALMIASEEERR